MTSMDESKPAMDAKPAVENAPLEEGREERRTHRSGYNKSRYAPRYVNKWQDDDVQERAVIGSVASWVCRDGSGTIKRNEGDEAPIFVHFSNIAKPNPDHLVATLADGELVQFDVAKTENRVEAVRVTGVKGKALTGHETAPARGVSTVPSWAIHFIPAIDQPTRHYGQKMVHKESGVETDSEEGEAESKTTEWTAKWKDDDIVERNVLGTIKWFQMVRGFGFVARDDAGETADLFVHRTSVLKPNPKHIIETLGDEERIKFDIVKTEKGQEAINVTSVDGGAVVGSSYAPVVGSGYIPGWAFDMLAVYRSRHGKGHRRIRRPYGPRGASGYHGRRRSVRTDDDSTENEKPLEKGHGGGGRKRQPRHHRKPRKVVIEGAETGDVNVAKLIADVEKVTVEN